MDPMSKPASPKVAVYYEEAGDTISLGLADSSIYIVSLTKKKFETLFLRHNTHIHNRDLLTYDVKVDMDIDIDIDIHSIGCPISPLGTYYSTSDTIGTKFQPVNYVMLVCLV